MEDKTLNFDRPFLSVRRCMPTLPSDQRDDKRKANFSRHAIPQLPPNRSELKSGPIRNPGSVPFLWEQTPGQPKEEATPNTLRTQDQAPLAPKLPPGRYLMANQKDCDKPPPSTKTNQDVIVPATSDNKVETFNVDNENVGKGKSSKDTREEESSDSGDSDTFVDALDTLSRTTESTFLNCSITDVNELENLDVKSSGIFSKDPQAQKFMMDRFLPAAKAMASDTLHYATKRQPVVQEQPKQVNKGVNQFKPSLRYGPSFAKRHTEYRENEEEDSEDDSDQQEYMRTACGLLPRFCLKGSIGCLNPVPGMSVRTRAPASSYKTRNGLSSAGSYSETYNELRSDTTEIRSVERIQATEPVKVMAQPRNNSKPFEARTTVTSREAPLSFLETKEVPSGPDEQANDNNNNNNDLRQHGKGFKTFQEVLADRDTGKELDSGSSVIEKTLYVDTVQKLETGNLISPSHNHAITTKKMDQIHMPDSTADDFKEFDDAAEGEKVMQSVKKYSGSSISSSLETSKETHMMEVPNASTTSTGTIVPIKELADNLAPPPLPKSPSDSWLLRTLPGISKNSSSLHSHLGAAKSPQNHSVNDVKWETIVKATKLQHHHIHRTVGMLTTIPEG